MSQEDDIEDEEQGQPDRLRWPDPGHSLRKTDPNWMLNSCLGWSKGMPTSRIMGYRSAAELVFERLYEDRVERDTLIYPLVFLWRHAIELQLKNIVDRGQILLGETATYPKHHGLGEVWKMAVKVIEHLQEEDNGERDNIARVIDELCALDPDSAGFRYHETKKGHPTLETAPENIHLGSINEALAAVSTYLDCVETVMEQAIDYLGEGYGDMA